MIKTLIVDNFTGSMTPRIDGDINSGQSYWLDVFGYDPFTKPGNLTWEENPTLIDSAGSVITDLIMAGKTRVESGVIYVYAIGHTGRLYKIQVNDPTTFNPDYDNPVLLATLTSGSPTFTRGGFIDFFGATEKIYIGHDKGVTTINFDGTTETAVSGTWTQTVPRPFEQFLGKLYIGNGTNIAEIDSTATQTSATKLSPGFPINTQVRDIRTTPDGNYLTIVVTQSALGDLTSTAVNVSLVAPTDSYIFRWNGTDTGYTSSTFFPNVVLTANIASGTREYTFGYDLLSNAVFNPIEKLLSSLPDVVGGSTLPNGVLAMGNLVMWAQTLVYQGNLNALFQIYGNLDNQNYSTGFWCPNFPIPTSPETDTLQIPLLMLVSSLGRGQDSNGYADGIYTTPKVYYSTFETSPAPTSKYRLYKWPLYPTGLGTALDGGLFQTLNQIFSKKITLKEVRVYGDKWVTNNSFTIDLIGTDDTPLSGGSKTFTAGSNLIVGDDFAWYTPDCAPTYTVGLRITNAGTANHVISKVEIDYTIGGK